MNKNTREHEHDEPEDLLADLLHYLYPTADTEYVEDDFADYVQAAWTHYRAEHNMGPVQPEGEATHAHQ